MSDVCGKRTSLLTCLLGNCARNLLLRVAAVNRSDNMSISLFFTRTPSSQPFQNVACKRVCPSCNTFSWLWQSLTFRLCFPMNPPLAKPSEFSSHHTPCVIALTESFALSVIVYRSLQNTHISLSFRSRVSLSIQSTWSGVPCSRPNIHLSLLVSLS